MHANCDLITGFLKNKLKFRGFVISDWQGIDRITNPPHSNNTYSVQAGILAGIDKSMLPESLTDFINEMYPHVPSSEVVKTARNSCVDRSIDGLFQIYCRPLIGDDPFKIDQIAGIMFQTTTKHQQKLCFVHKLFVSRGFQI